MQRSLPDQPVGQNNSLRDQGKPVRDAKLPKPPAIGRPPRNWQLLPPIVTDKVANARPTFYKTNNRELTPPTQVPPSSSEQLVASAFLPASEPQVPAKSPQEELFDLWTLSSQESLPAQRLGSAQRNAKQTEPHPTQRSHPSGGRKIRGNERLSRRKVVALLAVGGVTLAGTTIAFNLIGNTSNQQPQNNTTNNQQVQINATNLTKNAAMNFVNPADGKAIVLIHLTDGNFAAYDRHCTHTGVFVAYDPAQQLLVCPAHGATFDPAQGGAVVQGVPQAPLLKPLPKETIYINPDGTIIVG